MIDVKKVFFDSLRMYFAPLVGAFKAVKAEINRFERVIQPKPTTASVLRDCWPFLFAEAIRKNDLTFTQHLP